MNFFVCIEIESIRGPWQQLVQAQASLAHPVSGLFRFHGFHECCPRGAKSPRKLSCVPACHRSIPVPVARVRNPRLCRYYFAPARIVSTRWLLCRTLRSHAFAAPATSYVRQPTHPGRATLTLALNCKIWRGWMDIGITVHISPCRFCLCRCLSPAASPEQPARPSMQKGLQLSCFSFFSSSGDNNRYTLRDSKDHHPLGIVHLPALLYHGTRS